MDFGSPFSVGADEVCPFEHHQMLGDGLTGRAVVVLHDEASTDVEQNQAIALDSLIEDLTSRQASQSAIHIAHNPNHRQAHTCMSVSDKQERPDFASLKIVAQPAERSSSGGP